jgi:hypothetical protein
MTASAAEQRHKVEMPAHMQEHMLGNMRDHLRTINAILQHLNDNRLDQAAAIAEQRLGMSSLDAHGASHMAKFMPKPMQDMGTNMHHAASRFALKAQEGDVAGSYRALQEVTASCIACHDAYRIR